MRSESGYLLFIKTSDGGTADKRNQYIYDLTRRTVAHGIGTKAVVTPVQICVYTIRNKTKTQDWNMMNRLLISVILLLLVYPLNSCNLIGSADDGGNDRPFERRELPRELSEAEAAVVNSSGDFGFNLIHRLVEKNPDVNHFVSPLSILMAYGMAMNGAGGDTYSQMQQTFGLDGMSRKQINEAARELIDLLAGFDEKVQFNIANSIWFREGFNVTDDFLETNQVYFDARIEETDFNDPETVNLINGWVSDNTEGLIGEIIEPPIDPKIVMYLINAIYFHGEWTYPFDPGLTGPATFHRPDGSETNVEMMQMERPEQIPYMRGKNFQAVNLYYGDAGYAMTLVLPDENVELEMWLSGIDWQQWAELTDDLSDTRLHLEIPKFELEYEVEEFKKVMMDLGIVDAFGSADFSRITGGPNDLYISESKHKTFISVDEKGTEAAAVTSGAIPSSAPPTIRFNRPFFYVIREVESNTILFMGTMIDPS